MPSSRDTPKTLATAVAVQDRRIEAIEKCVFGNGKPSIEERVFSYMATTKKDLREEIQQAARHGKANMQEGDTQLLHELKREREERERQHAENKEAREQDKKSQEKIIDALTAEMKSIGKKTDRNTAVVAAVGIAFTILTALRDFGIIHIVGGK